MAGYLLVFAAVVLCPTTNLSLTAAPVAQTQSPANPRIPVLVELFTSEGCSSCPPADALLARLDATQPFAGVEVIPLEEHVDYWNSPAWRDPFSSTAATVRQREYALMQGGKQDQIYTPQIVVDGGAAFNGSEGAAARQAIQHAALEPKSQIQLEWLADPTDKERDLHVRVAALAGPPPIQKAEVYLAITESGLHSQVKGGENAGLFLGHTGVLRRLISIGNVGSNSTPGDVFDNVAGVRLRHGWNPQNVRIVVFIQDGGTGRIYGAAEVAY